MSITAERNKKKSYLLYTLFVAFLVICPIAVTTGWGDMARASIVPVLIAVAYIGSVIINRSISE